MLEKEYVEKNHLIKTLINSNALYNSAVFHLIKREPTADVVEIVRCKDCILRNTDDCAMNYKCDCGSQYSWENDTDFCSWDKRSKLK